ncbi:hypothetical protein AA0117_g12946 [Alternaria alternata]|uniref:Uncharacterized protein n=1 Tax=Alternaria alternata TaxID=5599 RepID=A0A4Q4MXB8_ALTAL|nr:hypothetical protein AA0117_g12946 [Alternaria alternata]
MPPSALVSANANQKQEAENYIWAIVDQWKEITLNWTSSIMQCMDFNSISELQSRAPFWSKTDLKFVNDGFEERRIFPLLLEPALREKVKSVVCSQGPILTLQTFAQDARLLESRVHASLKDLVLGLGKSTLRTRICGILAEEVERISHKSLLPNPIDANRQALFRRCYQHIFLHAIRNKTSITRMHISTLVNQELNSLPTHERESTLQSQLTEKELIATQAPADNPPDIEADIESRHGTSLFNDATATKHLYYDYINDSCVSSSTLTQSSMAKHIVRVFLLGRAGFEQTQMLTSSLPTSIVQSVSPVAQSTPFDTSPISACASQSVHSMDSSTYTAAPITRSVPRRRAKVSKTAIESMAASLLDPERLPASPSPTSNRITAKRSASVAMLDTPPEKSTDDPRPVKQLRREGSYREEERNAVLPKTADPQYRRCSDSARNAPSPVLSTVSPSVYSVDGGPSIPQPYDGQSSRDIDKKRKVLYRLNQEQQAYVNLIGVYPWSDQLVHSGSRSTTAVSCSPYTSYLTTLPQPAAIGPKLRIPRIEFGEQPQATDAHGEIPKYVVYRSFWHDKSFLRIPRTRQSTIKFVENQQKHDDGSTFLYYQNRKDEHADDKNKLKIAVNAEQLDQAIERFRILTVYVKSDRLGRA